MQSFYAPGKILLAGEYGVLLGLNAYAFPVKKGQWLEFFEFETPLNQEDILYFNALDEKDESWITEKFHLRLPGCFNADNGENEPLHQFLNLVPQAFWKDGKSYRMETRLEFPRTSGLGSSSTFIALMSQCFQLNPQNVQKAIFQGSGYDVAIATVQKPLVFWRNEKGAHFRSWKLSPALTENWSVLFLGEKVNSRTSTASILESFGAILDEPFYKMQFEKVLSMVENAKETASLEAALEMYQMLIAQLLEMPTPYKAFDLKPVKMGLCKWLGAWGGDMLLVNTTFIENYPDWVSKFPLENWNDFVIYE